MAELVDYEGGRDPGEPSRELRSFPLFWGVRPGLSEAEARAEWRAKWDAWYAAGPRTLARHNRKFEGDVDWADEYDVDPRPRAGVREHDNETDKEIP
jgi:hypothetical protein